MKILVTGAAGFIGSALSLRLSKEGHQVIGIDNLNDYYNPVLKQDRLEFIKHPNFEFIKLDLCDQSGIENLFKNSQFDCVYNLAAQAGVRYSLENPHAYIDSNIKGFLNILEACRNHSNPYLIYASTSSVYGASKNLPFSESEKADTPIALYGATKRANELMAHAYAHLFGLKCVGLRFFTVYGPWGRPDMALFKFTKGILEGKKIDVYNNGKMSRNFTYIDDIVEGLVRLIDIKTPTGHQVYNLGSAESTPLMDYVHAIEKHTGKKALINYMPMQPGDLAENPADMTCFHKLTGFVPKMPVEEGVKNFVDWYQGWDDKTDK